MASRSRATARCAAAPSTTRRSSRSPSAAGRTPAQVIIRWHLQHEIVVIPKSVNADRIRSNADVGGFSLSDEDMATLDGLGNG